MNQVKRFAVLCIVFSVIFPLSAGKPVPAQKTVPAPGTEAVRIELVSVTGMSAAVSRLGNCIAPNFKDTLALLTVALTIGGSSFGMDLTRPVSIVFYEVGEKPSMRITAYAIENVQVIQENARLWDMTFHARLKNGLVTFFTEDLSNDPTPASPPGQNLSDSLLFMKASPEGIMKHFSFHSLKTRNESYKLIFQALDELMPEVETLGLSFRADDDSICMKISVTARKNSALEKYLAMPLPEKGVIESFDGADSLALLRLAPNETLCRLGTAYLFRNQNPVLRSLPSAVTGFAVLSSETSIAHTSAKLALGIRPAHMPEITKSVGEMGYTPYQDLFQIMRDPPLFCSASGNRIAFYYSDTLEKTNLEQLLKQTQKSLDVADVPFAFYDLANPKQPIAELRFNGRTAQMTFQAPDEWFAMRQPLVDVPLHKLGAPKKQ